MVSLQINKRKHTLLCLEEYVKGIANAMRNL